MTGVFREGHNKRPTRRNEPLIIGPQANPWKKRASIGIPILFIALLAVLFVSNDVSAHPGHETYIQILDRPIAGVEEAESEYRTEMAERGFVRRGGVVTVGS